MSSASIRRAPSRRQRSLLNPLITAYRQLFGPSDWLMLVVTLGLVLMPVLTLNAAEWEVDMAVVSIVALSGVVLGFAMARSHFNEFIGLLMMAMTGAGLLTVVAGLGIEGGTTGVITRMVEWFNDAMTGGINQDPLVFTMLVGLLIWFLAYNTSWHIFRVDRPWRAILPPALIIVLNAVFYEGDNPFELYLFVFLFLALIALARSALEQREWEWFNNGVRVPKRTRRQFLLVGGGLAGIMVVLAWFVPVNSLDEQLQNFQDFLRSDPLAEMSEVWNRLFAPLSSEGPTSADYYGGDRLELSGAVQLGDQIILAIAAPNDRRYYWRSRVFDTYELGAWASAASIRLTTPTSPTELPLTPDLARVPVSASYTIGARSLRIIHTAPQATRIDLPTRTFLSYITEDKSQVNVAAIRPISVLQRGANYGATSLMSVATADQLRNAGANYPAWVATHPQYLRTTPNVISESVRELAAQIVADAGATNNYDKAKAVERWLRSNISYNQNIPNPPSGMDPLDWFLFDLKEGYCNYYATAMIVMLRSQNIPARMAGGFSQGAFDAQSGQFIVKESDAHTWVEAYFPGYGWIEFEPTANQEPLNREGDDTFNDGSFNPGQLDPTETPTPTPSPTLAPTSTPTLPPATESPTPTLASDQLPENTTEPPTATPSPSPTPTPTATPVILPTAPSPVAPEPRSVLDMLLPALGLVLGLVVLLLLLIAALWLVYWWWEWRGLRGLSPISRAYARLERYLGLIGIRFAPQLTPEERRRETMRQLPGSERPVTSITRLYAAERYGRAEQVDNDAARDQAETAWSDARSSILKRWRKKFMFWNRRD
ncbi:MAG: hypothetical protein IPK52_08475 [Chloroflexi bacterium]|nr:hypothetical protein [Chloroflexota bacterium]